MNLGIEPAMALFFFLNYIFSTKVTEKHAILVFRLFSLDECRINNTFCYGT